MRLANNSSSIHSSGSEESHLTIRRKTGRFLWGRDPENSLSYSYFITPHVHSILRIVFAAIHVFILVWALITMGKPYYLLSDLTFWGFLSSTLYFILVHIVKFSHNSAKGWRAVYILGEMAAVMAFIVCPFYFIFFFSPYLKTSPGVLSVMLQIFLHLICPILIWFETAVNALAFPLAHVWVLVITILVYILNNFIWSKCVYDGAVYSIITWDDGESYIYLTAAVAAAVLGFFIGWFQYNRKKARAYLKPKASSANLVTRLV